MTRFRHCLPSAIVALALGSSAVSASAEPASAEDAVDAIWRVYEVDFTFRSPKSYYACTPLREKIRTILRGVGAHPTIKVKIACDERVLLSNAYVTLIVAMPEEATSEAVAAATTFTSTDELAARVRGEALPTPTDIERFPAAWQKVSLSDKGPLFLSPGDCDLLSDLNRQVFPKLGIRAAERFSCFASATRVRSVLQVEALVPVEDSIQADAVP